MFRGSPLSLTGDKELSGFKNRDIYLRFLNALCSLYACLVVFFRVISLDLEVWWRDSIRLTWAGGGPACQDDNEVIDDSGSDADEDNDWMGDGVDGLFVGCTM